MTESWAVDAERREVTVHRTGSPDYRVEVIRTGRLDSMAVAGFWVEVDWLWQVPLPVAAGCLRQILT